MTGPEHDAIVLIALFTLALFLAAGLIPLSLRVEGWVRRMVGRRG